MQKTASTGQSRVPGCADFASAGIPSGAGSAFATMPAAGRSSSRRFSIRLVSLPPGTHRLSLLSLPSAMALE